MEMNQMGIKVRIQGHTFESRVVSWGHTAKSIAGKLAHVPAVQSVCAFDNRGIVYLYIKKDEQGHVIKREVA